MNKKSGFYLIELILIILLASLILKFTLNKSNNFFNSKILQAQTEKIYQTISALKNRAQLINKKIELKINLDDNSYSFNNQNEKLNKNIKFGFLKHALGPPSSPTKKIAQSCTFKNNIIEIKPTGEITKGTLYLKDKIEKHMTALSIGISKTPFIRKYQLIDNKYKRLK